MDTYQHYVLFALLLSFRQAHGVPPVQPYDSAPYTGGLLLMTGCQYSTGLPVPGLL